MKTRYRICESHSKFDLTKEVEALIRAGWQPAGGVSVHQEPGKYWSKTLYVQAMFKPEPEAQ